MGTDLTEALNPLEGADTQDYVTMYVMDQLFGIPVLQVQDILNPQRITRIPLAPPEVAGSLNLRGRIVTAFDVRTRLGLPKAENTKRMSVVVEHKGELYSLIVDKVGEVLTLDLATMEKNPPTLKPTWRDVSSGIYRLEGQLMVVLDVDSLLDINKSLAA